MRLNETSPLCERERHLLTFSHRDSYCSNLCEDMRIESVCLVKYSKKNITTSLCRHIEPSW